MMPAQTRIQITPPSLLEYFANLPDPRLDRCKGHDLLEIIAIAILATICGAEHFTQMEEFGREKEAWLKTFLKLKNGIPSHDTFARVFARLNPVAFEKQFINWVQGPRPPPERWWRLMARPRAALAIARAGQRPLRIWPMPGRRATGWCSDN